GSGDLPHRDHGCLALRRRCWPRVRHHQEELRPRPPRKQAPADRRRKPRRRVDSQTQEEPAQTQEEPAQAEGRIFRPRPQAAQGAVARLWFLSRGVTPESEKGRPKAEHCGGRKSSNLRKGITMKKYSPYFTT